jgi:hypothetical protein
MMLAAGSKLGPCEILVPVGAGGMGEMHRARRRVAGSLRICRLNAVTTTAVSLLGTLISRAKRE